MFISLFFICDLLFALNNCAKINGLANKSNGFPYKILGKPLFVLILNNIFMCSTVNERIMLIISRNGYKSKRAFAEKIGVAQTSLNDVLNGAEPKFSTLNKILTAEPLISAEWLMRGEGDMYKSENQAETPNSQLEFTVYVENGFLKVK